MVFFKFAIGNELTLMFINICLQMLGVSIMGSALYIMLRKKSAAVRSYLCMAIFISMICVASLSILFYKAKITWVKPSSSSFSFSSYSMVIPSGQTTEKKVPEINTEPATTSASSLSQKAKTLPDIASGRFIAIDIWAILELVWLSGCLFMLLKLGYGIAVVRGFRIGLKPVESERIHTLTEVIAQGFEQKYVPRVYSSLGVESPVTVGLIHPAVIIPEKLLSNLTDDEIKSILLHELAHVYNYDHIAGIFKRIVIAVNWWNPLVFYISSKHAYAREEVADNHVTRELSPGVYSRCLANLAEKICLISSLPFAIGMAGSHSNLEQRIRGILASGKKGTLQTSNMPKLVVSFLCIVFTLVAAGVQAQPRKMPIAADSKSSLRTAKQMARQRMEQDLSIYNSSELKEIETIYQKINRNWNKKTAKASLDILMNKYSKANRTGCALLYYAQMSSDDEQKELLEKAIKDYSDCFYGDGVQVGAYARYYLALFYLSNKNIKKANKIYRELKSKYPNAIDHSGVNLVRRLKTTNSKRYTKADPSHSSKLVIRSIKKQARARMRRDYQTYSPADLKIIESNYQKVNRKWDKKTAKASLDILMNKYSKANRTGCALLYYAQMSRGNEQKELLEKAIKDYSDCFYGDGVQVGAYARYYLALFYLRNKNIKKAYRIYRELNSKYPNAINHARANLNSQLYSILQSNR